VASHLELASLQGIPFQFLCLPLGVLALRLEIIHRLWWFDHGTCSSVAVQSLRVWATQYFSPCGCYRRRRAEWMVQLNHFCWRAYFESRRKEFRIFMVSWRYEHALQSVASGKASVRLLIHARIGRDVLVRTPDSGLHGQPALIIDLSRSEATKSPECRRQSGYAATVSSIASRANLASQLQDRRQIM
jgi:hypothetical protein